MLSKTKRTGESNLKSSSKHAINYNYKNSINKMKKISLILAAATLVLLTSCSSGWSCKSSYCNAKQTKTIEQKKNA
jgi:hypothetical protein